MADNSSLIPLARAAKAILKQIMRHQFGEHPGSFAFAVSQNTDHGDPGVVVEDRHKHTAEERKRRNMRITERFSRFCRIRLHKTRIRMRQVHHQKMDLAFYAADDGKRFTKISLSMTRRVR